MDVVISTQFYQTLCGGELWVYDTAHALSRRGHRVRVHAGSIGELFDITDDSIVVSPHQTLPYEPDCIIAMHPVFSDALVASSKAPVISVSHSQYFEMDAPVVSPNTMFYVVVDESLIPWIKSTHGIRNPILIRNGTDTSRFKPSDKPKKYGLVPGSINFTRMAAVHQIVKDFPDDEIWFVGYNTLSAPDRSNIKKKGSEQHMEDIYAEAKWVAGLVNGRVQYEAWACGLPYYAYTVEGKRTEVTKPDNFEQTHSLDAVIDKLEDFMKRSVGNRDGNAGNQESTR